MWLQFSGENSTLWPQRPGLESQQPHSSFFCYIICAYHHCHFIFQFLFCFLGFCSRNLFYICRCHVIFNLFYIAFFIFVIVTLFLIFSFVFFFILFPFFLVICLSLLSLYFQFLFCFLGFYSHNLYLGIKCTLCKPIFQDKSK